MKEANLSVTPIRQGTVIDHISAGQALRIVQLLRLSKMPHRVSIGLNLKSSALGSKDLIKIEDVFLTEDQTAQIALFSPHATVNVIENFLISHKYKVRIPRMLHGVIHCPNRMCITKLQGIASNFEILQTEGKIRMRCCFCEKAFLRTEMPE